MRNRHWWWLRYWLLHSNFGHLYGLATVVARLLLIDVGRERSDPEPEREKESKFRRGSFSTHKSRDAPKIRAHLACGDTK